MTTSLCISTYSSSSTALSSITDADSCFNNDIYNIAQYVATKLGAYSVGVELAANHVYTCCQEAYIEFSNYVNAYQIKNNLSSILGRPTGSLTGYEQKYIHPNLEMYKRIAAANEIESDLNSDYTIYSSSFSLVAGQQMYDLQSPISTSSRIQILEVWHYSPFGAQRYYPSNEYTNSVFIFGQGSSFTSDQAYYLLPVWQDVSRVQAYKFSFKFRRSLYSYDLNNNVVRIYPVPTGTCSIWYTYRFLPDPLNPDYGFTDTTVAGVANLSNAPYGLISWCGINSLSKQWIRKFAAALAKRDLGEIRSKYQTVPIPGAEVTLNGSQLVEEAKVEIDNLREELKEWLEETTFAKIAERDATMLTNVNNVFKHSPLPIFRF